MKLYTIYKKIIHNLNFGLRKSISENSLIKKSKETVWILAFEIFKFDFYNKLNHFIRKLSSDHK